MRKLVSVQQIKEILPIKDADQICVYKINGWSVVDRKDKYKVGDLVAYFEIDSFLPVKPEFEFLRKSSYKKLIDGTEGFRLRTIKLRGQVSQGLIMPIPSHINMVSIGEDLTDDFKVVKYDPPLPAELNGEVVGTFPSFIPKTDEIRVQNMDEGDFIGELATITEKLDGTSSTFFYNQGEFGACSRNYQLRFNPDNTFFKVAAELKLEEKLKSLGKNISIQGELIGPGIQKNRYKLNKPVVKFFTAFDIDKQERYSPTEFSKLMSDLQLETVPVLEHTSKPLTDVDDLLKQAEGKSVLNKNTEREGFVIRGINKPFSFKVISNKFLLKDND